MFYRKVYKRLFFDQTCPLCHVHPASSLGICEGCHVDLPWNLFPCPRCGISRDHPDDHCRCCNHKTFTVDRTFAALEYRFPLNTLLPSIKQRYSLHHLGWLSQVFHARLEDQIDQWPDVLIPVPMHALDLIRRGYNQAAILAELLGKATSINVTHSAIIKTRCSQRQHNLNASQRRTNLIDAFCVTSRPIADHIALIDDVMTTGSTLNELARLLKKQGCKRVDAWVLARTPDPDSDEDT